MTKTSPVLPLEEFLADITAILRGWPRERLEGWILAQGRVRSPRERGGFLADLKRAGQGMAPLSPLPGPVDLLGRIDDFLEELEEGVHYREPEWGDEDGEDYFQEEDEAWADAWDELLGEAKRACLKGDWDLGAEAYEKLLQAFALQEEDDVFGEEIVPEHRLESDLTEATLLYLRAVYETVPPDMNGGDRLLASLANVPPVAPHVVPGQNPGPTFASRAESVLAAMEGLYLHPEEATLAALGATGGPRAMEGFQAFVNDLATLLEARGPATASGWDGYRNWLPEALVLSGGREELRAFLDRCEFRHAQACREVLRQALAEHSWEEALETARVASRVLEEPRDRTWMLDAAAHAAELAGRLEEAADFRHTVWRQEPGEFHLLAWLGSCPEGTWKEQLSKELGRLPEPLERFPSSAEELWALLRDPWSTLAGSLATTPRPQHWDRETRRLFSVLAVVTLEDAKPPSASLLAQAWSDADRAEPEPWGRRDNLIPEPELRLGPQDLFAWKRETAPPGAPEKALIRDSLVEASRRWATQTLKGGDRPAYFEVARLMGIAAETLILAGRQEEGLRHLQAMLAAFPRHRAFAQEMATVRAQSSLLK